MEIERKYLLHTVPFDLSQFICQHIRQAYLSLHPEIRIRKKDNSFYLTKKSDGTLTRLEEEVEISEATFLKNESLIVSNVIDKTRYIIPINCELTAELDVYNLQLKGLIVVEVEFPSVSIANSFIAPSWFGKEITENKNYKNKNLSILENLTELES